MGISYESLHKRQIYYDVQSMMPQLFPDGVPSTQFTNKQGGQLSYHFPKIIDYQEQTS